MNTQQKAKKEIKDLKLSTHCNKERIAELKKMIAEQEVESPLSPKKRVEEVKVSEKQPRLALTLTPLVTSLVTPLDTSKITSNDAAVLPLKAEVT